MRIAIFALLVASGLAQPRLEIQHVSGPAASRLREAEGWWSTAHRPWRTGSRPEEREVVTGIITTFNEYFQPDLDPAPKIATLTEAGKDILAARWVPGHREIFTELIVWDTPDRTTFLFRLRHGAWSSEAVIQTSLDSLLRTLKADHHPPLVTGVRLDIINDPKTQQWVGSGLLLMNTIPRPFSNGPDSWFYIWDTADASFLAITFNWYRTTGYPPNMREIGERFPPLTERARQWNKQRLIDELVPGGFDAMSRDRILTKELLMRDVTNHELLMLLRRRKSDISGTVLIAIVDLNQVSRFSAGIREYLRTVVAPDAKSNNPFNILNRVDEPNFTDAAIDALHHDVRATPAFRYATKHGTTIAEYEALAALPPLQEQQTYLLEMSRRLRRSDR
jgi:hypothetical protein